MDTDATVIEPDAGSESTRTSARTSGRRSSIELITRAEPRRRWSIEQKQSIAAESLAPGASPTEVACRYGVSSGLLYAWRKALLAAQPNIARFARVEVAGPAGAGRGPDKVTLPLAYVSPIEFESNQPWAAAQQPRHRVSGRCHGSESKMSVSNRRLPQRCRQHDRILTTAMCMMNDNVVTLCCTKSVKSKKCPLWGTLDLRAR